MKAQTRYLTDERRWKAVVDRDKSADGAFYYAVKTTGIFCRPGCASRLPNRDHVIFFASSPEALAAGYRPCMRCRPGGVSIDEELEKNLISACRVIAQSDRIPKLKELAETLGLSPYHFHRMFKKYVGVTPKQFGASLRARRLSASLRSKDSVTEAIYDAGYSSSSGPYNRNQDRLSMRPGEFRAGAAGITVSYAIARGFLGWTIVGATDRGICAIEFGDDPASLPRQLQDSFPKAQIVPAGPGFTRLLGEVVRSIESPRSAFNLPLDIQGTAFQQKVWNVLRTIAPGTTLSYTEVAEKIGNRNAARAVASACAANKLAVVIPCHRILSKDGGVSGYRWGIDRKQALLDHEKEGG
ncbi:MAG: bifunctional DNA-binding transcriptional regulator/O6-methylguanine-DNA methyltransferase Ada [Desulfofustis sp.]|jgi:AraC family transcriptional regulator of adaptative response/methylated-DNA-[protein]-cysteine methyltransferase|nr:bifunctional DNA-binding transcriptional regulator/O6-methylguanine-DNA methyltransferase Ada [Desulfofustis sp.]